MFYYKDKNGTQYSASTETGDTPLNDTEKAARILYVTKHDKINEINKHAQAALISLTSTYPAMEVATWANQHKEALDYIANKANPTPTISAIAGESKKSVAEIATSVIAKANLFSTASGEIIGKRKDLTEQIELATTSEELNLITWG